MEKNKRSKRNKKILAGAGALACIALLAGTYAWLQSEDTRTNKFTGVLSGNDVSINELWKEPNNWTPGQEVVKEVGIMNTGEYDEFVRVSFKEALALLANVKVKEEPTLPAAVPDDYDPIEGEKLPANAGWLIPVSSTTITELTNNGWKEVTITNAPTPVEGYSLVAYASDPKTMNDPNKQDEEISVRDYKFYWKNGDKYYQSAGIDSVTGNADGTAVTIDAGSEAQFAYISAEYNYDKEVDAVQWWASTKPANDAIGQLYKPWKLTNAETGAGSYDPQNFAELVAPAKSWWVNSNVPVKSTNLTKTKAEIAINFVNMASQLPEDKTGAQEWYYNVQDGYFYYLDVLGSGKTTPLIIDKVKLENGAGNEYTKLRYNLDVKAEAIQSIGEAAKDEWNLSGGLLDHYKAIQTGEKTPDGDGE